MQQLTSTNIEIAKHDQSMALYCFEISLTFYETQDENVKMQVK